MQPKMYQVVDNIRALDKLEKVYVFIDNITMKSKLKKTNSRLFVDETFFKKLETNKTLEIQT